MRFLTSGCVDITLVIKRKQLELYCDRPDQRQSVPPTIRHPGPPPPPTFTLISPLGRPLGVMYPMFAE